jgi:hypothetical protein
MTRYACILVVAVGMGETAMADGPPNNLAVPTSPTFELRGSQRIRPIAGLE